MIELAIMIEGQDGLNWPRWQRIVQATEDLGFAGLYRSDHFTNADAPDKDSLELWTSFVWLASHTKRIEFGPLVSPVSFRDPVFTARVAYQIDDLSNGRLTLGVGAGWQEREHTMYGYDLMAINGRFERFIEGLDVITGLLQSDERFSYDGKYYQLKEATLLPRPERPGGPPILIGGNGPRRTLPLAAKYATEWNGVYLTPAQFAERNTILDEQLEAIGRESGEVRRSLMTAVFFGRDQKEVDALVSGTGHSAEALRGRGALIGNADQIVEQLGALEEAGVQRVMLQWLQQDDMDRLEAMAHQIIPQVS
jgi:F420-dependent oxidoreductase-like protein